MGDCAVKSKIVQQFPDTKISKHAVVKREKKPENQETTESKVLTISTII